MANQLNDVADAIGQVLREDRGAITAEMHRHLDGISADIATLNRKIAGLGTQLGGFGARQRIASAAPSRPALSARDKVVRHAVLRLLQIGAPGQPDSNSLEDLWRARYGPISKGVTNPAQTTVPDWAGNITAADFVEYLAGGAAPSLFARLSLMAGINRSLDGAAHGRIAYPSGTPSGGWIGSGEPIPVTLNPLAYLMLPVKTCGAIMDFSTEMRKRSDIEQIVDRSLRRAVNNTVDSALVDDIGSDARRPAGLRASGPGLPGGADMKGDLTALLAAVDPASSPVFLVSTLQMLSFAFTPAAIPYPVLSSPSIPAGVVIVVDLESLVTASGNVAIDGSQELTLHEADAPLPMVDPAGTVAKPLRSMFQTATIASRCLLDAGWAVADGSTAWVSGCTW